MMMSSRSLLVGAAFVTSVFSASSQAGVAHNFFPGLRFAFAASEASPESPDVSTSLPPVTRDLDSNVPHSPEADARIAKADQHFNTGRQYYFQNNLEAAKREFDAAVDVLLSAPEGLPDAG